MTSNSETKLIEACLKGEPRSQRELYDTFAGKIYAVCFRYSKNEDDAKDLLQETFVKVFNNLKNYKNEGSFEGWIRKIAVNTAIRHYQKTIKAIDRHDIEVTNEAFVGADIESTISAKEITDVIAKLPDGYRIVFNMYAIEGYSHKEIGKELDITESSSRSQLTRARKMLVGLLTRTEISNV
ncbi:MAG: RNA polymerase sigma factor (sigma-70 family) [Crocinitomicaceae bacterium]|jgi:RNA polymerase sigma factor (sigma-70 family)